MPTPWIVVSQLDHSWSLHLHSLSVLCCCVVNSTAKTHGHGGIWSFISVAWQWYTYFIYFLSALHTLHWERRERPQATGARRLHTCLLQAPPAASLQHLRSGERKKRGHVRGPLRRANVERSRNSGGLLWLLTFIYLFKMASVRGNLCLAFTSGAVSPLRVSLRGDTTEVLMSFTWTMI